MKGIPRSFPGLANGEFMDILNDRGPWAGRPKSQRVLPFPGNSALRPWAGRSALLASLGFLHPQP